MQDASLRAAVQQFDGKNWKKIAQVAFGDKKSDGQKRRERDTDVQGRAEIHTQMEHGGGSQGRLFALSLCSALLSPRQFNVSIVGRRCSNLVWSKGHGLRR
jgi:hypothetical protein